MLLDVWIVTAFDGLPAGQESQPLEWVPLNQLHNYAFPAANRPIVQALCLPIRVAITPDLNDANALFDYCLNAIALGATGIQLRAPQLSLVDVQALYLRIAQIAGVQKLWLNSRHLLDAEGSVASTDFSLEFIAVITGVHFCSHHLAAAKSLIASGLLAHCSTTAACHNANEIALAEMADIDAIVLSPILPTASHPNTPALGWVDTASLIQGAKQPIYLLGGMKEADLAMAQQIYAQGIAGISLFL
ncbi:MAG: thiamine phosphate synthase [Marinagarivorans sp.]|nr:thiamine phosphate synthase [Marinagarivorans sp.]